MAYLEMNSSMIFLIVDHVSGNVEVLKQNLRKMGYKNFVVAGNGFEAINYLRKNKVDFIFARHQMPVMSGADLMAELKADLSINRIPFTMFSESFDEGDSALLNELGVDASLTVPFAMKDLAEKVSATWSRYIDENNVEFQFEKGRRAFMQGNLTEAAALFLSLIQSGKIISRARVALARVERKRSNNDFAQKLCSEVISNAPNLVHGHQLRGELCLDAKDAAGALESFGKALELSPKNPFRYLIIGEILCSLKLWKEAIGVYERAHENGVDVPELMEAMATALINVDRKKEALGVLSKLVQSFPTVARYHNNLAVCYKSLHDRKNAIESYKRALDLEPENTKVMYNLGLLYISDNRPNSARSYLKRALELDPLFEKARMKLLQIDDPEAYKAAMASQKKSEDDDQDFKLQQTRQLDLEPASGSAAKKISDLYQTLQSQMRPAKEKPAPVILEPALLERISTLDDARAKDGYTKALRIVRATFAEVMKGWFDATCEISESLVLGMIDSAQAIMSDERFDDQKFRDLSSAHRDSKIQALLNDAIEQDATLKEQISPIIESLQFHDHVRQSLTTTQKCYVAASASDASDSLWKAIEVFFPTVEERGLFSRCVRAGLQTAASLPYPLRAWYISQSFLIEHLAEIINRMNRSNTALFKYVEDMVMRAVALDELKHKVTSILNWSLENHSVAGIGELEDLMGESGETKNHLRALLGTVQHSILLQHKLERFRAISKLIFGLHLVDLNLNSLKDLFKTYRPHLDHIWKHCELECTNQEERDLILKEHPSLGKKSA